MNHSTQKMLTQAIAKQLLQSMMDHLTEGDVLVGDGYYGTYFVIAALYKNKVDGVFKMHAARKCDFRKGKRLGKGDHVMIWKKPPIKPLWLDQVSYDGAPDYLTIREVKKGKVTLATTLCDQEIYPKGRLVSLYYDRWHIELDLRAIKDVMQMDILRCKSPTMVEKEIGMHLLGYNLIRWIMAQAAVLHNKTVRGLRIKF